MTIHRSLFSSDDETWATPPKLFEQLDREFGFDLDAAALAGSTKVRTAWYGPDHPNPARRDALARRWVEDGATAAWLNPPYGRAIGRWMAAAADAADDGATVVCLVPARTDTRWWHDHAMRADEVRLVKGRVRFGNATNSAPFPSAVIVFRPSPAPTAPLLTGMTAA